MVLGIRRWSEGASRAGCPVATAMSRGTRRRRYGRRGRRLAVCSGVDRGGGRWRGRRDRSCDGARRLCEIVVPGASSATVAMSPRLARPWRRSADAGRRRLHAPRRRCAPRARSLVRSAVRSLARAQSRILAAQAPSRPSAHRATGGCAGSRQRQDLRKRRGKLRAHWQHDCGAPARLAVLRACPPSCAEVMACAVEVQALDARRANPRSVLATWVTPDPSTACPGHQQQRDHDSDGLCFDEITRRINAKRVRDDVVTNDGMLTDVVGAS